MDKVFAFKVYPVTLPANGAFRLPAAGAYFRIMSSTGAVDVTVEGVGTLPALQAGQAFKGLSFNGLVLQDASGAPNTVQLLVASAEFQDNRLNGTVDISASSLAALELVDLNTATLNAQRAVASTGSWVHSAAIAAATPVTVLAPGANTTGVDLLDAGYIQADNTGMARVGMWFLAKSSAPANVNDGEVILSPSTITNDASAFTGTARLHMPVFVPAGLGIYLISPNSVSAAASNFPCIRHARWRAR